MGSVVAFSENVFDRGVLLRLPRPSATNSTFLVIVEIRVPMERQPNTRLTLLLGWGSRPSRRSTAHILAWFLERRKKFSLVYVLAGSPWGFPATAKRLSSSCNTVKVDADPNL